MVEEEINIFERAPRSSSIANRRKSRQFFSFREIDQNEDDSVEYDESFLQLVKQTWTMWGVSPLFDFQYNDEVKMKMYAKKLREEVSRSHTKENVSYTAKFTLMEDFIPKPNSSEDPAIQIELFATLGTVETRVYLGFLMSWQTNPVELRNDNCVFLPLLLCKGTQTTIKTVHSVLSRMFDCTVSPLPIVDHDLKWLTAINLSSKGSTGKSKNDLIMFEYVVPTLSPTDTIQVNFTYKDLRKMWSSVCVAVDEENAQTIRVEYVEKLFKIINKQMLELSSLNLGLCTLQKLVLPSLTIGGNKLKAANAETLDNILSLLNEIALDVVHISPRDSNSNSSSSIRVARQI